AIREPRRKVRHMVSSEPCCRRALLRSTVSRTYNLRRMRDKIESLPITSRAGNDRNASPGELDFMHGWTTNRYEGCVRTILTESGFSIASPMRDFNDLVSQNRGASRQGRRARGFSS